MMSGESEIEARQYGEFDVAVAGGGIAGISAALSSARNGAKTVLLERMFLLGGLATSGLVTVYLPLCDGCGNQVSFGIAEELLRLSVRYGCEDRDCSCWLGEGTVSQRTEKRFEVQFNASLFAILCEQLLTENGVEILYGTTVCDCLCEDGKLNAVAVENKSGRSRITAKAFVDASGDADLFYRSGVETVEFAQGNVLASWYYELKDSSYKLKMLGFADIPDKYKDAASEAQGERYTGLDAKEISDMLCRSHRNILADFLQSGGISSGHTIGAVATIPQLRMTRRIDGAYTMSDDEQHRYFNDSIGMISDWRKPGPVYEIPYGCLYGRDIENLFAAGRCISVTDDMWDISRVIPACAVTGQAAGTAAALSADGKRPDAVTLQSVLKNSGVRLHDARVG